MKASLRKPRIRGPLPGPKAKKVLAKDEQFISPSYTRSYPLVAKRALGVWMEDVDGNEFLDFTAGIAVTSTGHCHPRVVNAIKKQAEQLIHMSGTDFYYEVQSELAAQLSEIVPGPNPKRTFLSNSGAEAVEAGLKLARYKQKRTQFIAFQGAFHGRTMGALSLTCSKAIHKKGMNPTMPGVTHVPYPNCYRCPLKLQYPSCNLHCVNIIEDEYFRRAVPAEDVAAIVVEPIQGEGGYVVPPPDYFKKLKALAQKYGILLMIDEVQSGIGRTGKYFAIEHFGVTPDIVATAKGIASGMPLGATIAPAKIMDWPSGSHANTFGGNPLSCAAAIETLALLKESLLENARVVGKYLKTELEKLQKKHRLIGDVRGIGLMLGIEIVTDPESKEARHDLREDIVDRSFQKGLLLLGCGYNTVRFCPGLVVTKQECDSMLSILDEVLSELES